jgi:drug/metabolite transporter (DMT)-like permease
MPTPNDLLLMISCGVTAAAGVTGLTFAYREAEANLVASFEYTALVWAAILGFLIWNEVPKLTTVTGAALIVGAGLLALAAGRMRRGPA